METNSSSSHHCKSSENQRWFSLSFFLLQTDKHLSILHLWKSLTVEIAVHCNRVTFICFVYLRTFLHASLNESVSFQNYLFCVKGSLILCVAEFAQFGKNVVSARISPRLMSLNIARAHFYYLSIWSATHNNKVYRKKNISTNLLIALAHGTTHI